MKEASHKGTYIIKCHLYEVSGIDKSTKTKTRLPKAGGGMGRGNGVMESDYWSPWDFFLAGWKCSKVEYGGGCAAP